VAILGGRAIHSQTEGRVEAKADYLFYLSYARGDLDGYLERFEEDLAREVRARTGAREPMVFFDRDSIALGSSWPSAIAAVLAASRVLVALLSPAYFASEWCGKEWEVFRRRRDERAGLPNPPGFILPVRWIASRAVPRTVAEMQIDAAEFPDAYRREGLRYLMKLRRLEDDYEIFVAAFVRRLIEAASREPRPSLPPAFDDVANAFAEPPGAAPATGVDPVGRTVDDAGRRRAMASLPDIALPRLDGPRRA